MKTRCPCCGAENSLDALIAHEEARQSLWAVAQIGGPMSTGLVRYLGLFRPASSALSQSRMATLMAELLPMMQAGHIQRNGKTYPAPPAAWAYAFGEVLAGRDNGNLVTPLKSHGYLLEVISKWQGQGEAVPMPASAPAADRPAVTPASKTVGAMAALEEMVIEIHDPNT
ncbi:hypothetical protein [Neisseria shayeganii]|uniref:DUF2752 domain-containing protein n=1 Tax=Neisseria shayeganii TaxID=607712 RepID=A0A7D7SP72_9NEIS|nr:hypothetical protein [Neisseria shayeganii]QMT39970.1 hypothetical protein H3L94_08930 [Neisseria shayeganii]